MSGDVSAAIMRAATVAVRLDRDLWLRFDQELRIWFVVIGDVDAPAATQYVGRGQLVPALEEAIGKAEGNDRR